MPPFATGAAVHRPSVFRSRPAPTTTISSAMGYLRWIRPLHRFSSGRHVPLDYIFVISYIRKYENRQRRSWSGLRIGRRLAEGALQPSPSSDHLPADRRWRAVGRRVGRVPELWWTARSRSILRSFARMAWSSSRRDAQTIFYSIASEPARAILKTLYPGVLRAEVRKDRMKSRKRRAGAPCARSTRLLSMLMK